MARSYGIDVSQHNGYVDVSKYDFVIIRATWGTNADTKLDYWVEQCNLKKVPYGLYCYSYAVNADGGKSEAEFLLSIVKNKNLKPALGLWLDMEDADGYKLKKGALTTPVITAVCRAFLPVIEKAGYYTGVYSNKWWWPVYMPTINYPKWIAHWNVNDGQLHDDFSKECVLHQYTSNPIDKDISYADFKIFQKKENIAKETTMTKRNQKLSIGGYQVLIFPMEYMNITQGNNIGTHIGTNAIDCAGKDIGIDPTFAPCDMHYVTNDSPTNGNAIWFQSDHKVMFADGTIDYATFMFIHDNYIGDILQVRSFKQGQEFGDEGTAGKATGNHVHMEVAKGKYSHMYARNAQGTWHLPNNISADLAFVTDGTKIINKGNLTGWHDSSTLKPKQAKIGITPHCQSFGWMAEVYDGTTAGTTGKSKRMEALRIETFDGTIIEKVEAHMQGIGWKIYDHPGKNTIIGTTGQARRLEALRIKTSKPCKMRGHIQNIGWTDWIPCDGDQMIGTTGKSLRLEAIEIKRA